MVARKGRVLAGLVALFPLVFLAVESAWPHEHASVPAVTKSRPALATSAAFAPNGDLIAVSTQEGHVVLQRSVDLGANWATVARVNAEPEAISADGENRPKVAFAPDGAVLVSWTRPLSKPYTGEIRYSRAADGEHFSAPITVHRDRAEITHRFDALGVSGNGAVYLAWIDKRDGEAAKAARGSYRGAAIYTAISTDGGISFQPERKLADHSCECCRIATANDVDGSTLLLWRHVFEPNERDHALARLNTDGSAAPVLRATHDRWRIDACPHHGPSLAVDAAGERHAVWFNQVGGEGHVYYGRLPRKADDTVTGQRVVGGPQAAHADLVVSGQRVGIVWKEFDGQRTVLRGEVSEDGGRSFVSRELATTEGASDQPRALKRDGVLFAFWRSEREGMRLLRLEP